MPAPPADSMRVKDETGPLATVADIRVQEIPALRQKIARHHVDDDLHCFGAIEKACFRPKYAPTRKSVIIVIMFP